MAQRLALGARTYDIEFTPPILKECQKAIGRPLLQTLHDARGWRGFSYEEIEWVLFACIRRQNDTMTQAKVNLLLERELRKGRPLQEFQLALVAAFNECGLEYKVTTPAATKLDDEDAEATAEPGRIPPVPAAPPVAAPVAAVVGTFESQED